MNMYGHCHLKSRNGFRDFSSDAAAVRLERSCFM